VKKYLEISSSSRKSADFFDDPRLGLIAESWSRLPEIVRAGIAAMVKAASNQE
jgi:hypothetical protein